MGETKIKDFQDDINLKEIFFYLLGNWYVILIAAIIMGAAAWAYSSYAITPMYTSTTSIYVINEREDNQTALTYSDTVLALQFLADYKELIVSRPVLENTITRTSAGISPGTLKRRINVANTAETRVINISVTDPSPSKAQEIANTLREESAEKIKEIIKVDAVQTVSEATYSSDPSSPNIRNWTLLGALLGIAFAMVVLIVLFALDNTIKTSEDVERYLGWPTLALIPERSRRGKKGYGEYYYVLRQLQQKAAEGEGHREGGREKARPSEAGRKERSGKVTGEKRCRKSVL